MEKKLYVGNLSYDVNQDELGDLFAEAGPVVSASVVTDRFSGQSRGFGFVEMETEEGAQEACSRFDGYEMKGRALRVNEARPQTRQGGPRGGGGGRGGDRDRGGDRGGRRW